MRKCIYSEPFLVKNSEEETTESACQLVPNDLRTSRNFTFRSIFVPKHLLPPTEFAIDTAQKWLQLPGKDGTFHQFPLQTILPKVQMTRHVPPKQLPRDVEVDRRRRQYARVDLQESLKAAGLCGEELHPTEIEYFKGSRNRQKHILPLSFFDNADFDCHSPQAWFNLAVVETGIYNVPAKAYLPSESDRMDYKWQYAAVLSYDSDTKLWKLITLADEMYYEVPKIQIMFLAENPNTFVQRVQEAVTNRNNAEKIIMMEAIVDCVTLQQFKDNSFMNRANVDKLFTNLHTTVPAKQFKKDLHREVCGVFEHLMACYEFDKFVKLLPKEFPNFTTQLIHSFLPKAYHTQFQEEERKSIKSLKLNMIATRYNVLRTTLYYIAAGLEAMGNVVAECQYIETLSIFVCSFSKPLPLNDFLQSQQQNSSHVAAYLKNFWPQKISSGISLVLRALGKGWLDIMLDKWTVYQMCKISRFILQVKLRMQESMQVLLEKSIENFSKFLIEPCRQFLNLDENFKWSSNHIITEFPFPKPVFSLVIGVSEEAHVVYSTPPEDFEPSLLDIFKKALEKTSGVRCIDAETLINLRFAPNLYLLTVELIEDLYVRNNAMMKLCYQKAVLPLLAYSRLYERFIQFYLLKVSDYMYQYENAKKSSMQVKLDILEHKRQKQEIRDILPANIVIGPFLIIVDPMKQYMIKKHIEIIKKLFEYYIQRMYDINEALLEECSKVYNKINERPQSIEHLYSIRDFALIVPEKVEQLKADIQIMWLEYEMLDGFFYNLSDAQFAMKWNVYAWPHTILMRLSTLREEQKIDIDEFKRLHLSEIIGFEERLESLNDEVQAFSLIFDPNRVQETAVDVKKTWKIITELQKWGNVLQYRQGLFELEELSLEFLESIIDGFTPYRNLWSTCMDFVKLEEATLGNPLHNIDLEDVWNNLEILESSLITSKEIFHEKPEIQNVAQVFLERIEEFKPMYECIKWLKNENWLLIHWGELSMRSGVEIKYSITINFQYLLKKNIMTFLDLVQEISEKAEQDADALRKQWEEEERLRIEAEEMLLRRKALRKCRTDIL